MSAGSDFRERYLASFEAETPGDELVLGRIVQMLDRVEQMEDQIARDGLTVEGGNRQMTAHPLIASVRADTAEVARLVKALGMQPESINTTRARKAAAARWAR